MSKFKTTSFWQPTVIAAAMAASAALAGCVARGHTDVEVVDDHGYHHHGYYDERHDWHGGYYDEGHAFHADAADWHSR